MLKLLNYLYSLNRGDIRPGLQRIIKLLNIIKNPEKNIKIIHIAGTNGKGSVCSLIASILQESGLSVGLYTSPHIFNFNERIKINGKAISDEKIVSIYETLADEAKNIQATFFEITTAIAFKYFQLENVDIAVIETGLGGQFDSTNVVKPLISVITTINLEHQDFLGDTIEQIAKEKAGIIKTGVPVVLMPNSAEVTNIFLEKASEKSAEIHLIPSFSAEKIIEYTDDFKMKVQLDFCREKLEILSPLIGRKQAENLQTVLKIIEILQEKMDLVPGLSQFQTTLSTLQAKPKRFCPTKNILAGIENVITNTGLRFRFECVQTKPKLIFDVAHNPDAINRLVETLAEVSGKKFTEKTWNFVFGAMRDKNIEQMLQKIKPICDKLIITRLETERAAKVEMINKIAIKVGIKKIILANSALEAAEYAAKLSRETIVTGSFYTVSEVASALQIKTI